MEGRDQDDRASLLAAWRRVRHWKQWSTNNLHVRELLLLVLALDRSGSGVEFTKDELAERLETTGRAIDSVVKRAEKDFRLLEVVEQRINRGGQRANRYRIDWVMCEPSTRES